MNDTLFFDNFCFNKFSFLNYRHNDISSGTKCHYIAYLWQGSAKLESDDISINVSAGEFFYIPRGLRYHSYWNTGKEGIVLFDSYGFKHLPRHENLSYPLQKISATDAALEVLAKLSVDMKPSCRSVGLFYQLLGILLEDMRCVADSRKTIIVQEAENYMRENIGFSAADIAKHCGICESALYLAFKEAAGCTPVEAKHKIFTQRATELLLTTDMSVEEISAHLGFGTAAYFRKIFTSVTGKTPREIRRESVF